MVPRSLPSSIVLQPHPTAREKAVLTVGLPAGSVILSTSSLAKVLLPAEKGRRCDFCFSLPTESQRRLRRCTGCFSYWYCGTQCQVLHWRTHQRYCKNFGQYIASHRFSQLDAHEKLNAILLTHLLAEISASLNENKDTGELSTFLSLLPGPVSAEMCPPTCPLKNRHQPTVTVSDLYTRCGNNNFSVHSHFTTIAHGVFPLASRLFNHSCLPNAIVKYYLAAAEDVRIAIVAIRDIAAGEEICIPYVDCALLETRQRIFRYSYGFTCNCISCVALESLRKIDTPVVSGDSPILRAALRNYVFPAGPPDDPAGGLPDQLPNLAAVPPQLHGILQESFLAMLCESFSNASHDGPLDLALETGLTVLSFYLLVYPPNYPQTGMHLLEMAKTAWNTLITCARSGPAVKTLDAKLLQQARAYLYWSKRILDVIGSEGDGGGPLTEIEVLEGLLDSD